VTHENDSAIA